MSITTIKLAKEIGFALKKESLMLTTAESCTGGGLSYWITSTPGSADWFDRGFVTYSNAAKIEMLGVKPKTIEMFGAVSKETVQEMAEGALQRSHAQISIAITGIAGPSGGSTEKPVGTVWIAWAKPSSPLQTAKYVFPGGRQKVRTDAIKTALEKLLLLF